MSGGHMIILNAAGLNNIVHIDGSDRTIIE